MLREGQECVCTRILLGCVTLNKFFTSLNLSFPVCNVEVVQLTSHCPCGHGAHPPTRTPEPPQHPTLPPRNSGGKADWKFGGSKEPRSIPSLLLLLSMRRPTRNSARASMPSLRITASKRVHPPFSKSPGTEAMVLRKGCSLGLRCRSREEEKEEETSHGEEVAVGTRYLLWDLQSDLSRWWCVLTCT